MLKYILFFIAILSFSITKIYNTPNYKTTEVTITIPELTNIEMINHLQNELNKENEVYGFYAFSGKATAVIGPV